jgi:hypothetical protein
MCMLSGRPEKTGFSLDVWTIKFYIERVASGRLRVYLCYHIPEPSWHAVSRRYGQKEGATHARHPYV